MRHNLIRTYAIQEAATVIARSRLAGGALLTFYFNTLNVTLQPDGNQQKQRDIHLTVTDLLSLRRENVLDAILTLYPNPHPQRPGLL